MNPPNTPVLVSSPSTPASRAAGLLRRAAVAALLGGAAVGAMAQYKIVGPDGRVTYTDQPPVGANANPLEGAGAGGGNASSGSLPYETRQAANKYPVALYTGKNCQGCDAARQWLRNRGVPFSEYTVDSNRAIAQVQQRFNTNTLPVITVGGQTVIGFSSSDLQSYIDAAGYPAQAHLAGYSWPAPVPLVANATPAPAAAPAPAPAAPPPVAPPTSNNGIRF